MRLEVAHETTYRFDEPLRYGLQKLRLSPMPGPTQSVLGWDLRYENCSEQVSYVDYLGNRINLIRIDEGAESMTVTASGVVDTHRTDGIIGDHRGALPLWYYRSDTALTEAGSGIAALVESVGAEDNQVAVMHALSAAILDRVTYELGGTGTDTTAEDALAAGHGVCQDHTHIFVTAARSLGAPARYVSGYLLLDATVEQSASHAWAEAWLDGLGWVGFDVSNGISADERYVRVAVGRDYNEAAPIYGLRYGNGGEELEVALEVQQSHGQSQDESQGQSQSQDQSQGHGQSQSQGHQQQHQ